MDEVNLGDALLKSGKSPLFPNNVVPTIDDVVDVVEVVEVVDDVDDENIV